MENLRYFLTGAATGALNGFFGGGGGALLAPLLTGWVKLEPRRALATSVTVMLPLSAFSALIYWLRADLPVAAAVPFLISGAAGGLLGGFTFKKAPTRMLRRLFAALLLYGAVSTLFFPQRESISRGTASLYWDLITGLLCGVLSGWGVGGGSLLLLYLTRMAGFPQIMAQGINLLYFLPTAGAAAAVHGKSGLVEKRTVFMLTIPGALASLPSAILATKLDSSLLRRLFALFLLAVGVKMLFEPKKDKPSKQSANGQ